MKDSIYTRMTKESWKRDRFSMIGFTAFVAISVALISLTALLFANLTGAIEHLMEEAKTPDFLQMHTGEINEDELEQFALGRSEVTDYQIVRFLNLENSILTLGEETLLDSTQDNGVSVQSDRFDFMFDLNNELPKVKSGQVYVPVCYESLYHVKIGDDMKIGNSVLRVAGFIRDSQMNSMMASSKRFLVSEEDYENLKELGSEEYLIEFLLAEGADSNAFKTAYENAKLPMNGPTITRPLIKMMNTLSDGIMIMIILLVSVLVLIISLVCIRFMLLTRVAAEAGEVGMLKAIGISRKSIRSMFLKRYRQLVFAGAGLGMMISLCMFKPLSAQMQKLYGVSANGFSMFFYLALSAVFVGSVIVLFVLRILRKLNEMTALKALSGNAEESKKKSNKLFIALVTAIAVFLMMIPSNLYSTISSPKFVTYMGIGDGELRMDMRQGEGESENFEKIGKLLSEDTDVKEYVLYQTNLMPVKLRDGTNMNMLMEQGDHRKFPVNYSKGCAPACEGEVALSYLLSEELELYPGDEIFIKIAGKYKMCTITGVYSDITNGGKTAKLFEEHLNNKENVMWRIAYVTLTENASQKKFIDKYSAQGAEVMDIISRIEGTYGPTLKQVFLASVLVKIISFVIILIVIMMFVRMIIENQRNQISIKKAIGFRSKAIKKSFRKSCAPYVFAGIIAGAVCGCTAGEWICGAALRSFGAEGFQFTLNMWSIIMNVVLGGTAAVLAICLGSNGIKSVKAVECCRGRE
ncbi:MAG: FtsX-like permease family protein [Lachnospiraceae bacterium]